MSDVFKTIEQNSIVLSLNDSVEFGLSEATDVNEVRIQFDLDYTRQSVSPNKKMQWFAQKLNEGLDFVPMKVASINVKFLQTWGANEVKLFACDLR